jgi:membrane-bound metal-dependent hydrolase YbcI (DUF457 family)
VYLGHVGVALGAKGVRPRIALLALLIAAYAPDWVDSGLCIVGAYNPRGMLSHSFAAIAVLAALAIAAYASNTRDFVGALVVAAVVVSHMLLDWVTGYKPTWPGGPMIGLRLYARPALNLIVEGLVILAGVMLYRRSLPPRTRGWIDVGVMLGALVAMQAGIIVVRALTVSLPKC